MRAFSLYLHIPFCSHKCPYCDFNTYAVDHVPEAAYVEALLREIDSYSRKAPFTGRPIQTIFFGGGTPSLLSPASIEAILHRVPDLFDLQSGAEVTLEANPFLVNEDRLSGYRNARINRLSFGAQSFNQRHLSTLGREHSASDIDRSVQDAIRAGITNISLDLLFGVPGQSVDDLRADVAAAVALPLTHLSAYSLTIEPGTPFFQRQERKLFSLPADETVREMLDLLPDLLGEAGLKRYEISNYAKEGFESRHNTAYWVGDDYLGVGAGAHSLSIEYDGDVKTSGLRWSNTARYGDYMEKTREADPIAWREKLKQSDLAFEFFYLGLRRMEGVDLRAFENFFSREMRCSYEPLISALEEEEMMARCGSRVFLTKSGVALADSIFERFILDTE